MSFIADDEGPNYLAGVSENDEIGKRIREVRRARDDLSQSEFAAKLTKVTRGAVGNWERGKGIKRENLQMIADKFRVSFEWLASGRGQMDANAIDPPNAIVGDKLEKRAQYMPLYGHAVGGVDGEFILNGNKLDDIPVPPGMVITPGAYAVTVAGESIEPRYMDGETVYVDPDHRVHRGDFVVAQIRHDAEDGSPPLAYIKRFIRHNDIELVLEQFNPPKELRFPHDRVVSVHYIALGGPGNLKYRR